MHTHTRHIHVWTHTIYIYIFTLMFEHAYMHVHRHIHAYICIERHMCTYISMHTYAQSHIWYAYLCTKAYMVCTCIHVDLYRDTHTYPFIYMCAHLLMHIYVYIYMHTHAYPCISKHIDTCIIYTCTPLAFAFPFLSGKDFIFFTSLQLFFMFWWNLPRCSIDSLPFPMLRC